MNKAVFWLVDFWQTTFFRAKTVSSFLEVKIIILYIGKPFIMITDNIFDLNKVIYCVIIVTLLQEYVARWQDSSLQQLITPVLLCRETVLSESVQAREFWL